MTASPPRRHSNFLRDQRLSLLDPGHAPLPLLDVAAARDLRDRGGFREPGGDSPWKNLPRPDWLDKTCPGGELLRTIVVADAGLGKTTNLGWLAARLTTARPSQMVFFLGIDRLPDDPDDLLEMLIRDHWRNGLGCDLQSLPPDHALRALRRRRDTGHLTLVLDSLDQALSRPGAVKTLQLLLTRSDWGACPIVVSTRPHALTSQWDSLFAPHENDWRFVRIEQLDEQQQRFLLGTVVDERDPVGEARIDRFDLIPAEGRTLLGVPRVIDMLRKLGTHRKDYDGIRTLADVYWRCTGDMLLEGLKADKAGNTLEWEPKDGEVPATYRGVQRDIARNILGAVAFEMYVNPTAVPDGPQRPNLSHVDAAASDTFLRQVYSRLAAARVAHESEGRFEDVETLGAASLRRFSVNFNAVAAMNAGPLENYLLDALGRHRDIRWRNPTMQAFFAAAWVGRNGTPADFERLRGWVVAPEDDRYGEYREFWRFACELGDTAATDPTASRRDAWVGIMSPLYDGSALDTAGRQVRSCEFICRSWKRMGGTKARADFLAEFPKILGPEGPDHPSRPLAQTMLAGFVDLVRNQLPGDTGQFTMGAPEGEDAGWDGQGDGQMNPLHPVTLTHYRLHRYCVSNVEYELFDPRHRDRRWSGKPHPDVQKSGDASADDRCPAVNVSWYDAWCFARWLGVARHNGIAYTITLPTEAQWEYACRAGAGPDQPFSFGPDHEGKTCTADVCNFYGKAPFGPGAKAGEYRGRTIPVNALGENKWTFVQMHGNVFEWCADWFAPRFYRSEGGQKTDPVNAEQASSRVLRGGCWSYGGRLCRSAFRYWYDPANRFSNYGFRLAAVPEAGAKYTGV